MGSSIIKPPRLKPGDRIGVISPAGPVRRSDLEPGLKALQSAGFEVRLAPHVYNKHDYLAGKDEARLSDMLGMFRDRDIKAVFCARGGYGALRLLSRVPYGLISDNPKIFVGYSDITALLMAIHRKAGLVTFHGPMVRELTSGHKDNLANLLRLLSSENRLKINLVGGTALIEGRAKGPLMGGNLSLICHLIGTPFLPHLSGCVLFLEDTGEPLYRIDRMLTHLILSDHLKGLGGLIVGQFEECGDTSAINRLFKDTLSDLNIPVATGLAVGHRPTNLTLPIGLTTELDTDSMTLSILEGAVQG